MCIHSVCYQMLMLHRGHLGTLWVCIEAFDRRYYSKVLPEWMVLRCWCKTSRTIIISHNKILRCILLGQDYFYNMSSWNLPCPNLKLMSVYRLAGLPTHFSSTFLFKHSPENPIFSFSELFGQAFGNEKKSELVKY